MTTHTLAGNTANSAAKSEATASPLIAGIITGQLAGLIMAVVMMLVFPLFLAHGPLYPVQVIGSAVFGESALQGIDTGAVRQPGTLHRPLPPSLPAHPCRARRHRRRIHLREGYRRLRPA